MRKKLLSLVLVATMVAGMAVGCGKKADDAGAATAGEGGKVLNIYAWNEEYKSRMEDHYPGYEKVDGTTGKIGDVTVKWTITPSDDNAYQNNLDETLLKQDKAAADDKIDIFLVEADYALKYVDTDYTMAMSDLGLDDSVFAGQYQYTKDVVTDANGALKGASWQGCPGLMVYRRDIATEVFGTDDPDEIQTHFSDWTKFQESAAQLADAGYSAVSTVNDTYRVFSNNVTTKWVDENNKINIDENIMAWVDMSKEMVDAKQTGTADLWSDDWKKGFYPEGNVFAYFGPAWLIDFCMAADDDASVAAQGGWAATEGPQSFYWGGTWICAANGTDNADLVADIIKTMTTDEAVLSDIVKADNDFANSPAVMEGFASDDTFGDAVLGGQNPIGKFCAGVGAIDLSNITNYDQGCTEEFQHAMKNYFDGNATKDEALDQFYNAVLEKYPNLSK